MGSAVPFRETSEGRCRRVADRQDGLLLRHQAVECGMHESSIDRRIAAGRWSVVLPRVYCLGGVIDRNRRVRAAALWAGERSAISHHTAAMLWRIAELPPEPITMTTERSLAPRPGVIIRRVRSLRPAEVTSLNGIAVTTPARTLLDLAAFAPEPAFEGALDEALRARLVSLAKLRWFVQTHGGRGRAGTALMKRMLAERAGGYVPVESPLEGKVWDVIVAAGLPRPVRQHCVIDGGEVVARIDFAYPDRLVALEVDGYRWHSGRRAWSRDLERRNRLTSLGWRVLHVTHYDVERRPDEIVQQLQRALSGGTLPHHRR